MPAVSLLRSALVSVSVSVASCLCALALYHELWVVYLVEVLVLLVYYIGCTNVVEGFSLYSI